MQELDEKVMSVHTYFHGIIFPHHQMFAIWKTIVKIWRGDLKDFCAKIF